MKFFPEAGFRQMHNQTIMLLFHESVTEREIPSYRIWHCAQIWQSLGFTVLIQRGCERGTRSDLVIPQIDLSVLPEEYRRLLAAKKLVVNRGVVDIRKSAFSRNLVTEDDAYAGPVIVKTDSNFGGRPERQAVSRMALRRRIPLHFHGIARVLRKIAVSGSLARLAYADFLDPHKYPVFSSKQDVPRGVFKNGSLVVEKFRPERESRFYFLRSYAFLGSEGLAVRTKSEHPVVKGAGGTDLEFVPVAESILAMRHELGFDYGKFDYVMHEGEAVLLDINATPTFGRAYAPDVRRKIAAQLAKGIGYWFPNA